MFRIVMDKFFRNGKGLLLAYDQGFEHGPSDFNAKNVDPEYILDIAQKAGVFTGVIFQKGIAERHYLREQRTLPPLIVKLNGKTGLHAGEEPFAPLLCTVDEALGLGASAV
ncbi:MAG: fructose-bisphosphate aldolase, partial [Patescibacteria group bacterium]